MTGFEFFKKVQKHFDYGGGSTRYKDIAYFEHIKPSTSALWRRMDFPDHKVLLILVPKSK